MEVDHVFVRQEPLLDAPPHTHGVARPTHGVASRSTPDMLMYIDR